ncbi:hypothetical protein ACOMHN_033086 [Nucella lapillus]
MSTRAPPPLTEPLHRQVLHALLVSAETDCREQIADVFNDLSHHHHLQDQRISRAEDLENWLMKRPQLFNISTDEATNHCLTVSPTTTLTCCAAHSICAGSCPKDACAELHICRYFLLSGKCPYKEGCHFGHTLGTGHNRRLLKRHRLKDLRPEELRRLFCLARVRRDTTCPSVCRFYNVAIKCGKGEDCHYIHLCKYFVTGKCKFTSSCMRSHNIRDNQVLKVLDRYGIKTEGCQDSDILMQIRASDSMMGHKKDGSGIDITQRSEIPPENYGTNLSSESDSSEEGEIKEDCALSSISSDDDENSALQQIPRMLKSIRERQERPEATEWVNESPQMSRYTEDRSRTTKESPPVSRLMQENRTRKYDTPRMPEDGERRQDCPETTRFPEGSTSAWDSRYNGNRGYYHSLQTSARERDDLTISVRKRDWKWELDHTRPDSPHASEHSGRFSSPNWADNNWKRSTSPNWAGDNWERSTSPNLAYDNWERSTSPNLAYDNWGRSTSPNLADGSRERHESHGTADWRRYRETSPVLEKKRRNESQQMAEDTQKYNLPQSENDRRKHGKKRRHSPQVPRLSENKDCEWTRSRSETHQRRHGLSKYPRKQRTTRSFRSVTFLECDTREDSPQTPRCSPENVDSRRSYRLDIGFQENRGLDEMQETLTRRWRHTSPSLGQRCGYLSKRGRRLLSQKGKSSSSLHKGKSSSTLHKGKSSSSPQTDLNKMDWSLY